MEAGQGAPEIREPQRSWSPIGWTLQRGKLTAGEAKSPVQGSSGCSAGKSLLLCAADLLLFPYLPPSLTSRKVIKATPSTSTFQEDSWVHSGKRSWRVESKIKGSEWALSCPVAGEPWLSDAEQDAEGKAGAEPERRKVRSHREPLPAAHACSTHPKVTQRTSACCLQPLRGHLLHGQGRELSGHPSPAAGTAQNTPLE